MNVDLHSDPANSSFEPETFKALVTVPRPSRERYPGLRFFAKHYSGDVGTEANQALNELDSSQAESARLRSQLEGSVDEIRRVAEGWVEARAEVVRLHGVIRDQQARNGKLVHKIHHVWTERRKSKLQQAHDRLWEEVVALRASAPVEGEPQHD